MREAYVYDGCVNEMAIAALAAKSQFHTPQTHPDYIYDAHKDLPRNLHKHSEVSPDRFLSIDPVTFMDTGNPSFFNRFAYTFNNPINLVDPSGMSPQDDRGLSLGLSGELSSCAISGTCNVEQTRENIAKGAEEAYDDGYGEGYSYKEPQGSFGAGTDKCNLFVSDICNAAGATVPSKTGGSWPPLAGDWADPNYKIKGWKIVEKPQRGDIVAQKREYESASGHVGIVTRGADSQGYYRTISAGTAGIQEESSSTSFPSFIPGVKVGPVVFRRYVGSK